MGKPKQLSRDEADLIADIIGDLASGVCVLRYNRHDYDPWSGPTKDGKALLLSAAEKLAHGTEAFGGDAFVEFMSNSTTRPRIRSPFGNTEKKGK